MKTLLLTPQDILFFRDGRPMSGSLAGHGAAWPLPHIIHQAFHAAFHRAGLASHAHNTGNYRTRDYTEATRTEKYGSLKTAGPFPVSPTGEWFAPAPADRDGFTLVKVPPSSLPKPLTRAVAATQPPTKEKRPAWVPFAPSSPVSGVHDADIFSTEARIGIGMDAQTQTQDGDRFYSAHYLRLREGWKLGVLAEAADKDHGDLITAFLAQENRLILGGQQGVATIEESSVDGIHAVASVVPNTGTRHIKWTLLTPALFTSGWRPDWIHPETGAVKLPVKTPRNPHESRAAWRERVQKAAETPIAARLVAALVPKPLALSGWDLQTGAKPTQLAVPAGAVYYFEADTDAAACDLATALHFTPRSTLLGEKGYGLGVCGTWETLPAASNLVPAPPVPPESKVLPS